MDQMLKANTPVEEVTTRLRGFTRPRRRTPVIKRSRLFPEIPAPLTLLNAPTGYGKTIALAQWEDRLSSQGHRVVWLRLSALDFSQRNLWQVLADALDIPQQSNNGFDARQLVYDHVVSIDRQTVLMIDDYQLVTSVRMDKRIVELVELNDRVSVVVSSPHFVLLDGPLVTSRVSVHISSEEDLALTPEESWDLAKAHGWTNEEDVRELCRSVRGWPVPLHSMLTAVPFKPHRMRAGVATRFTEYQKRILAIADDFLDRLDDACTRQVLLLTAFCPDLSVELIVDALAPTDWEKGQDSATSQEEVAGMILRLQNLGLVLPAHSLKVQRYRCHPGLEGVLSLRAQQEMGQEFLQQIQRKHAADVSEEDPNLGIRLLCELGEFEAVERSLRLHFIVPLFDDEETRNALNSVPQSALADYPSVAGARLFLALNDPLLPESVLQELLSTVRSAAMAEFSRPKTGGELRALSSLAAAEMYLGNCEDALLYARDLERRVADGRMRAAERGDMVAFYHSIVGLIGLMNAEFWIAERNYLRTREISRWSGDAPNEVRASRGLALLAIARGEVTSAEHFLNDAETIVLNSHSGLINREYTLSATAMVAAEHNDYKTFQALMESTWSLLPRTLTWPLVFMAEAALMRGRKGTLAAINRLNQRLALPWVRESGRTYFTDLLDAFTADLNVMLGNHKEAEEQLDHLGLEHPAAVVAQARLEFFGGSGRNTLRTLRQGKDKLHSRFTMEADLLTALASWQLGFPDDAVAAFESAVHSMSTVCGFSALTYVPFKPLQELTDEAADRGVVDLRDHVQQIPETLRSTQFEPLTPAELRTLEVLTGGQPLEEVAKEMFVSMNTMKFHLRSIYRKLHVTGRDDAVNQAARMGLV